MSLNDKMWRIAIVMAAGIILMIAGAAVDKTWLQILGIVCVAVGCLMDFCGMNCPHCGQWLGKNPGKHCRHCGAEIDYKAKK